MDRALDERLVLIVKPKPGAAWGLPESAWQVSFFLRKRVAAVDWLWIFAWG